MNLILFADGGSRGNPGPAAAGACLVDAESGETVARLKSYLGTATNNQAEYAAVVLGLTRARELCATTVDIRLDSKLIVEQLSGRWKIKDAKIKIVVPRIHRLLAGIAWSIRHIPRAENARADALVNDVLDARGFIKSARH